MEFYDIDENTKAHPGEYLLHIPSKQIVMCGAYKPDDGTIRALHNGRLMEDKIHNFQKIKLSQAERRTRANASCSGCKK